MHATLRTILSCVYYSFTFSSSVDFFPETGYQPKCPNNYGVLKKFLYCRDCKTCIIIIGIIFIVVIAVVVFILSVLRCRFLQANVYSIFFHDDTHYNNLALQNKKKIIMILHVSRRTFFVTGIIFCGSYLFLDIPGVYDFSCFRYYNGLTYLFQSPHIFNFVCATLTYLLIVSPQVISTLLFNGIATSDVHNCFFYLLYTHVIIIWFYKRFFIPVSFMIIVFHDIL